MSDVATGLALPPPPVAASIPLLKSCESCRQRKIKCSGDKPICTHCARRNQPCIYRRSARYKRRVAGGAGGIQIALADGVRPVAVYTDLDLDPIAPGLQPLPGGLANAAATTAGAAGAGKLASEQLFGEASVDDNIPLAALFGSAPINESDILPPSILQSMNLWMNDSMLTGNNAVFPGTSQIGLLGSAVSSVCPTAVGASAPQFPASHDMQQPQGPGVLSSLIPMDVALGLPALGGSMALANVSSSDFGSFGPLPLPPNCSLGEVPQDFLQQLMPFDGSAKSSAGSPYVPGASIHSPLTATSPGLLLGSSEVTNPMSRFPTLAFASLNLVNALDLQHSTQISHRLQATTAGAGIAALLPSSVLPQMPAGISADPASSSLAGAMQPVPNAQSAALSVVDSAASLFPEGSLASEQRVQLSPHNSRPMLLHGYRAPLLSSPPLGTPPLSASQVMPSSGDGNVMPNGVGCEFKNSLGIFAVSNAASASDGLVAMSATAGQQLPPLSIPMAPGSRASSDYALSSPPPFASRPLARSRTDAAAGLLSAHQPDSPRGAAKTLVSAALSTVTVFDIPYDSSILDFNKSATLPLSALQNNIGAGPRLARESRRSSGASSGRTGSSGVVQINNDAIPPLLLRIVDQHPELGCPELLYNLLITHVVHDFSRIGIHVAHLFWMRVKQDRMPKFYLMASIADAARSWTLSDELRTALPPNLDEVCYALAIKDAPNDNSTPTIITAVGLLALAAYEFKSARFAPMLEHNCLAYKMMTQIKFRGTSFPWRAAKRRPDVNGVDSNYQLLLRAFWRMYIMLYFSTEIFRLDAPEDRDFLPEMPEQDNYFVRHVFVPDNCEELGFRMVRPPYQVCDSGNGDLLSILCELYLKQYKIGNRFNRILRGEKSGRYYINYLQEWDRQMLEWRDSLPPYLKDDLGELARTTQPLDGRRRRMNLTGLSENEMWMKRHQWNQDVGRAMEVLYVHMVFDTVRIKAHRIGLMILLGEDLDMVRNFQCSKAFTSLELPPLSRAEPVLSSHGEDEEYFHMSAVAANDAASHMYSMLKFSHQFGFDLHGFTTVIISTLLQASLVYIGQVQSKDARVAWRAMLRLARILGMIRSLDRWGPALYIFTNILKALGRPELTLRIPSPEMRAQLAADTRRPAAATSLRSMSVDSATTTESNSCTDSCCYPPAGANGDECSNSRGKRKNDGIDCHGNEKRYEFGDHHHGDPHLVSTSLDSPVSLTDEDEVPNPFPPEHVISHIMREQKVSTATFFSPTLPILAASLLRSNTT
ncbi:hypothetical protein GGI20_001239 [Coemansia sp. BCRC 34301]|nr:hypothetical protein GGI20_001239 [Coemansia sp. BCRC 34301]